MRATSNDVQVWFGHTIGDEIACGYGVEFPLNLYSGPFPDGMPTVHKWNLLAKDAMEFDPDVKLFMLAADDIEFCDSGWDAKVIEHYESLKNKIHCYHLRDSRNSEGVPHPILTREYIEAMGWFLPPYFLHWKCDVWTNEIAKSNNCFTHLKEFLLKHDKCNDRGQPDETHLGIRRRGWLERDEFVAKNCGYILDYEKQRLAKAMQ